MKTLFLLPTLSLTVAGCGTTDCLNADCGVEPADSDSALDTAFAEAKKNLEHGYSPLPRDTRSVLNASLARADDRACDLVGVMAVRWFGEGNEFDGLLLNLDGLPVAEVDGRFAPATNTLGVFAGGYTTFEDAIEPPEICTADPAPASDGDLTKGEGCAVDPATDSGDFYTTAPVGGTYRGDRTFRGALTRGPTAMPVYGAWMATHEGGGIAVGAILQCHEPSHDEPILVEPVSD